MDWAAKLRGSLPSPSPPAASTTQDQTSARGATTPPPTTPLVIPTNNYDTGMLSIPGEAWLLIFEWIRDRDVLNQCGRLCVYMRKLMLVDQVWRVKMRLFESEFEVSQGYPCCVIPKVPLTSSRFYKHLPDAMEKRIGSIAGRKMEQYFMHQRFHARDAMRQWNLREYQTSDGTNAANGAGPVLGGAGAASRRGAIQCSSRLLKQVEGTTDSQSPLMLQSVNICLLDRGPKESVSAVALTSFFDNVATGTPSRSGLELIPITDTEDPVWLVDLLKALSPPSLRSIHMCLRKNPTLVELNQSEAEALADCAHAGECTSLLRGSIVEQQWTRFFSGPELCSGNQVGIVLADPMRCILLRFPIRSGYV